MEAGLDSIRSGMRGVVMQVREKPVIVKRFRQIGLAPGTVVYCRYRSPGGSVVALEFRNRAMAFCTKDLRKISIACRGL